jgi:hypothetical protein
MQPTVSGDPSPVDYVLTCPVLSARHPVLRPPGHRRHGGAKPEDWTISPKEDSPDSPQTNVAEMRGSATLSRRTRQAGKGGKLAADPPWPPHIPRGLGTPGDDFARAKHNFISDRCLPRVSAASSGHMGEVVGQNKWWQSSPRRKRNPYFSSLFFFPEQIFSLKTAAP